MFRILIFDWLFHFIINPLPEEFLGLEISNPLSFPSIYTDPKEIIEAPSKSVIIAPGFIIRDSETTTFLLIS